MKKKIISISILIILVFTITITNTKAFSANLQSENYYNGEITQNKIENIINNNMRDGNIPGLSVVIVENNEKVFQKGFGYADLSGEIPVNSDTLFELGSNSKAFTALALYTLIDKNLIDLDASVTQYLPWLKMEFEGKNAIVTIRDLLNHRSGIPFNTIERIPISNNSDALERTVKDLVGIRLDSKPGSEYQYATINYDVLGLVISEVTGVDYETFIVDNVFMPLGLENTFPKNNNKVKNMSIGYKINLSKPRQFEAPFYKGNVPAGYIISNSDDVAQWMMYYTGKENEGTFNTDLIKKTLETDDLNISETGSQSYINGWFTNNENIEVIEHGGNNPNYSSYILIKPDDKLGIAVMSNLNSDYTAEIVKEIDDLLTNNESESNINDLNKNVDKISIIIIFFSTLFIILVLYLIVEKLLSHKYKNYRIQFNSQKIVSFFVIIFLFLISSYFLHAFPRVVAGVSWSFLSIWLPKSLIIARNLLYLLIFTASIYFILSIFSEREKRNYFMMIFLSILSGMGNAIVIFSINTAVFSSYEIRSVLAISFTVGLLMYIVTQKYLRKSIIKAVNNSIYQKRVDIINYILSTPYEQLEVIKKEVIDTTLNNDTETISRITNVIVGGVTSAFTLMICFAYLAYLNMYALTLSIIIIVIMSIAYYFVGKRVNKIGEKARNEQDIFFKFINSLIGGIKELKLNEVKKKEFTSDMKMNLYRYRERRTQANIANAYVFITGEIMFILAIGSLVFVFPLFIAELDNNSIASFVFIMLYMLGPINEILNFIPHMIEYRISSKRIENLIKHLSTGTDKWISKRTITSFEKLTIELNKLSYSYKRNGEDSFEIGPIDYQFQNGEIIFITGGNGSGKSTLVKLISGLYKPTSGYISINKSEVSIDFLKSNFSVIFNDFYLFDRLYGIDYTNKEEEIVKYLKMFKLNHKVNIADGKFSTLELSTGQKKRLALLVALLEDKQAYIFDEWAAEQDPEFREFFYMQLLNELKQKNKLVIVITHDDQFFDKADRIIKMEMGVMK